MSKLKGILEGLKRELSPFQRKTLDYANTFSKVDEKSAEKLKETLVSKIELDEKEAAQIVNCMPESIEELRVFFPKHRVIETEKLQDVLKLIDEHRK